MSVDTPKMSRDIFVRIILSIIIIIMIFALHRAITISIRETRPALAAEKPLIFAHRGGAALAPENTMVAFENAKELGVDALELDVRLTIDGELVVIHDETLERTTNGIGPVRAHPLSDLKKLDAGYRFTSDDGDTYPFRDQAITIPTLAEVLAAFPDLIINIEIKDDDVAAAEKLAVEIKRAEAQDRTIVASFSDEIIDAFRLVAPEVATASTATETQTFYFLSSLGLWRFHRPLGDVYQIPTSSGNTNLANEKFITNAQNRNQAVHFWTINDPDEIADLLLMGANGIITDYPDQAVEVFEEFGYR